MFAVIATATTLVAVTAGSANAHGDDSEYLYGPADSYVDDRVQEVTDTADVILGVEWLPEVSGAVDSVRICLDLTQQEVNERLPLFAYLWDAQSGALMASGGAYGGVSRADPCFYDISIPRTRVEERKRYVVGVWLRGGQYSYVPYGLSNDLSNATTGHLIAVGFSAGTNGVENGRYTYTSDFSDPAIPTDSWQDSDYLISPRFLPDPH
jgi:hypothetical protein